MEQTTEVTSPQSVERYFQRRPSFSRLLVKAWAEANDHINFVFEKKQIGEKEPPVDIQGETIIFKREPTLSDILLAAELLRKQTQGQEATNKEGLTFQNSTLERFGLQLVDSAILLAQQKRQWTDEEKKLIETLFNLGTNLEIRAKKAGATPITMKFDQIKLCSPTPFVHPLQKELTKEEKTQRQQEHENSLLFFLLGKGSLLSDENKTILPYTSPYAQRYHQWLQKKGYDEDTAQHQKEFEQSLLKDRDRLIADIFDFLKQGFNPDELAQKKILERLDEAIQISGEKLLQEKMPPAPNIEDYLGEELVRGLTRIFGADFASKFNETQITLFQEAEEVLSRLPETASTYDKIGALWNLVQAYPYKETYIPKKAIDEKAIECNLRSYLLSMLFQQHLSDELVVFQDTTVNHSSLMVIDKKTLAGYFVDPALRKKYGVRQNQAVYQIKDQEFVDQIVQAWLNNPKMVNLRLKLNDQDYIRMFVKERQYAQVYHNIVNVAEGIRATLWNNLGTTYSDPELKRYCYLKALELNPNDDDAWVNLGFTYSDPELKRYCYLKALELNPNKDEAWYNLAYVLWEINNTNESAALNFLDPQTLTKLEEWLRKFINGDINPSWRNSSRIELAKRVLNICF